MTAEDLADLYSGLLARGVQLWVDGGWGIDALLGRQTRPHKDFDAMVAFEDLPALTRFLGERGFSLKLIWEENRWMPCPEPPALVGRERPAVEAATAFVLEDGSGREIDFHVVRFDEQGHGTPAWDSDLVFPPGALAGVGIVGGRRVRCLSAEVQMRTHTGYALKESRRARPASPPRLVRHRLPRRGRGPLLGPVGIGRAAPCSPAFGRRAISRQQCDSHA